MKLLLAQKNMNFVKYCLLAIASLLIGWFAHLYHNSEPEYVINLNEEDNIYLQQLFAMGAEPMENEECYFQGKEKNLKVSDYFIEYLTPLQSRKRYYNVSFGCFARFPDECGLSTYFDVRERGKGETNILWFKVNRDQQTIIKNSFLCSDY